MPRIPDVTALGARPELQAQTFATPANDAPLLRANANLARTLQDTGGRIAEKIDQQDAETQFESYRTALNQWHLDNIDSDATGIKNFKGADAFQLPQQLQKNFDDFSEKQLQNLTNPRARQAAMQLTDARRSSVLSTVNEYVHGQRETYRTQQYNAALDTSLKRMQADPSSADLERAHLAMITQSRLRDLGAPDEEVTAALADLNAKSYGAVLDGMLSRNELSNAVSYFDVHKNELGKDALHYAATVREAKMTIAETQIGDQITAQHGIGRAAYDAAAKIEDPLVRERVETRLDREDARQNRLREDGERSVRENAYGALESAPADTPLDTIFTPQQLVAINRQPGLRKALDDRQIERLSGKEVRTDFATWKGARDDILAGKPVDLTQPEFRTRISTADLKGLDELKDPNKIAAARIDQDDFNRIADSAGLHPFSANSEDKKRQLGALKYSVEQRIDVEQRARGGKELNREEKQAIAQQEIDNTVLRHNLILPDAKMPAALVPAADFSKAYVTVGGKDVYLSKIPADWRAQIVSKLRQANRPVTEQAIAEVWVKAGSPTQ